MEQRPPTITRWEYLVMEASINYGGSKFTLNGELNNQLKNAALPAVLNQLGAVGWEMISAQPVNANITLYTFKRPTRAPLQNLQKTTDSAGQ